MARLLHHTLADMDWADLRFADRSRLNRALIPLQRDIECAKTAAGQHHPSATDTTKAASSGAA